MSGGVNPTGDVNLPKEHQRETVSPKTFLTFRHLNSLAMMLVLAASGMVSFQDMAIVISSTIYIYFLSKFSFPTKSHTQEQPVFNQKSKILNNYVLFAAILGLLLPILYIFEGILQGDKEGIKAAVPHLFLLASQVFMEGVSVSSRFSLPIRVFVPVFYNSIRMFTLVEWVNDQFSRDGSSGRMRVGKGLAILNLGFWAFNLFGFLLPVYLPKAFQKYYGNGNGTSSGSKTE